MTLRFFLLAFPGKKKLQVQGCTDAFFKKKFNICIHAAGNASKSRARLHYLPFTICGGMRACNLVPPCVIQTPDDTAHVEVFRRAFFFYPRSNTDPSLPVRRSLGHPLGCLAPRGQAVRLQSLRWNSDHMERERPRQARTDNHPTR